MTPEMEVRMRGQCTIQDCENPEKGRSFCDNHLKRAYRSGLLSPRSLDAPPLFSSLPHRFWRKVFADDFGCWIWVGSRFSGSYAQFTFGKTLVYAHRATYEAFIGPIPKGLQIDHLCRIRPCVNPSHLEAVTQRENLLRGNSPSAQQARKTHCVRGHPLSGDNLLGRRDSKRLNNRKCRACSRLAYATRKARGYKPPRRWNLIEIDTLAREWVSATRPPTAISSGLLAFIEWLAKGNGSG